MSSFPFHPALSTSTHPDISFSTLKEKLSKIIIDIKIQKSNTFDADNKLNFFNYLLKCENFDIVNHFFEIAENYDLINLDMANFYIDVYRYITTYDRKHHLEQQPGTSTSPISPVPYSGKISSDNPEVANLLSFLRELVPSSHRRGRKRKSESISSTNGQILTSISNTKEFNSTIDLDSLPQLQCAGPLEMSIEKQQENEKNMEKTFQDLAQVKKKRGRPFGSSSKGGVGGQDTSAASKEQMTKLMAKEAEDIMNMFDLGALKIPAAQVSEVVPEQEPSASIRYSPVHDLDLSPKIQIGHTDLDFASSSNLLYVETGKPESGGKRSSPILQELTPTPKPKPTYPSSGPPPAMREVLEQALGMRPYNQQDEPLAFGNLWLPYYIEPNVYNSSEGQVLKRLGEKFEMRLDEKNVEKDEELAKKSEFTRTKREVKGFDQ